MSYEYDDYKDFYGENMENQDDNWWVDRWEDDADERDSCGYSDHDREDFHADEAVGYVSYREDGPFDD